MKVNGHFLLLKIGSYEFMNKFYLDGEMFFRRAKSFRKGFGFERGDKYELLTSTLNPHSAQLTINGIRITGITSNILVDEENDNPLIYSMYSISERHLLPNRLELVDQKCREFGDYVVIITDLDAFYELIEKQHRKFGYDIEAEAIEYVDESTYVGHLGRYRKFSNGYAHQEEWRIVLDNVLGEPKTIKLHLGSLEDIAILCKFDELDKFVSIENCT